jgi:SpoVK/Ycf46/Vps4 family AAA+-type ATPase
VARSDLLKAMFRNYSRGDDAGFRAVAIEIIQEERRKNHSLLADELEQLLLQEEPTRRPLHLSSLRPLPKGREDAALLKLEQPSRTFHELVLPGEVQSTLLRSCREFAESSTLRAHGLRPRNHLLFVGPPGSGKSVTAEAMGAELGLPIAKVYLASVVSSFLGETARNLQAIFDYCSQGSWVLFFDEFDALAKERGDKSEHGELKRVVTAFLQLLDDFRGNSLVVAATNHPTLLDEAVWRRFDEVIAFRFPMEDEIERLVALKLRTHVVHAPLRDVSARLVGMSGAEIEAVCYDALRDVVMDGRDAVEVADLDRAARRLEERRKAILGFQA